MSRAEPAPPPAIGVFDSGVGGLSVFAAVRARLPGARYFYCSDNAHFPYGVRVEADVVRCVHDATSRFIAKCRLDLLIIACNTASTVALPHLRSTCAVPVIGVVPAIKPAAQLSRTGTIGLLATPGTVQRPYTSELIQTFAAQCLVLTAGSIVLVELAEDKLRGQAVDLAAVATELAPLFLASPQAPERRLDTVVLGCTHFPLLAAELAAAAPWPVRWVDSCEAIAARADYLVGEMGRDARAPRAGLPRPMAFLTARDPATGALRATLAGLGIDGPEVL